MKEGNLLYPWLPLPEFGHDFSCFYEATMFYANQNVKQEPLEQVSMNNSGINQNNKWRNMNEASISPVSCLVIIAV